MKTSLTKLRNSSLLIALLAAVPVWGKPVAQVTEVNGQVFTVGPDGATRSLKLNDHLEEKSEVMVEEGATITLNDYYDATYHLIGGSHLKFFNKSVQLKRGKTWIQSKSNKHALVLTTANGHVDFGKTEFISTFDQANSRSQVLVVNGEVQVSNVLDRNMGYAVPAGSFTLVDPEIENGVPRAPTKVGLASLNNALAEFKALPSNMKETAAGPTRSIASVSEAAPATKKGEIIFISTNRMPASVQGNAHAYFKKTLNRKKIALTSAPIKFYGVSDINHKTMAAPRSPASIPLKINIPPKPAQKLNLDHEFDESLKKQATEQPKHSKELESLIQDLKSY